MPNTKPAKAYLIIERDRYGNPAIAGLRKERPALGHRQIAVRVVVNVPMALFETFIPSIEVELHEGEIIPPTVELLPETDELEEA